MVKANRATHVTGITKTTHFAALFISGTGPPNRRVRITTHPKYANIQRYANMSLSPMRPSNSGVERPTIFRIARLQCM